MRVRTIAAIVALMVASSANKSFISAQGTTYYVSTSGNDANPGSITAPWRTVQKAASTLQAGQTALVRGGTYTESLIRFATSGTAGNPITIKGYPGETAVVDGGYTRSSGRKPIFWIDGRNYITLDTLSIRRGSMSNVHVAYDVASHDITVQNCIITDVVTEDNVGAVYLDASGASNVLIQNNIISGRILGGLSEDQGTGIKIFRAGNIVLRNNEISNLVDGIFYKHNNPGTMTSRVENNKIHHVSKNGIQWVMHDSVIQNNLVYNSGGGIKVFEEGGTCDAINSDRNRLLHNTLVDNGFGVRLETATCQGPVDTLVKDNLIFNFTGSEFRGVAIYPYVATVDASRTVLDHNLIYSSQFPAPIRVLGAFFSTSATPSSVRNTVTLSSTPNFRNYSGRDFTLLDGPGKNGASDGTDLGARICSVGLNASCTATVPTLPSAPTNLRIVGH